MLATALYSAVAVGVAIFRGLQLAEEGSVEAEAWKHPSDQRINSIKYKQSRDELDWCRPHL